MTMHYSGRAGVQTHRSVTGPATSVACSAVAGTSASSPCPDRRAAAPRDGSRAAVGGAARVRCCGDCLAGEHDLDTDSWRTDFLRLVRRHCVCRDCDCTFIGVRIEEPRYDQRHYDRCGRGWRFLRRHPT